MKTFILTTSLLMAQAASALVGDVYTKYYCPGGEDNEEWNITVDLKKKTAVLFDNDSYSTFELSLIQETYPETYIFVEDATAHDLTKIHFSEILGTAKGSATYVGSEHSEESIPFECYAVKRLENEFDKTAKTIAERMHDHTRGDFDSGGISSVREVLISPMGSDTALVLEALKVATKDNVDNICVKEKRLACAARVAKQSKKNHESLPGFDFYGSLFNLVGQELSFDDAEYRSKNGVTYTEDVAALKQLISERIGANYRVIFNESAALNYEVGLLILVSEDGLRMIVISYDYGA